MTCSTCRNSSIPADKLGASGWLQCRHEKDWIYRAAGCRCVFSPVRWLQK